MLICYFLPKCVLWLFMLYNATLDWSSIISNDKDHVAKHVGWIQTLPVSQIQLLSSFLLTHYWLLKWQQHTLFLFTSALQTGRLKIICLSNCMANEEVSSKTSAIFSHLEGQEKHIQCAVTGFRVSSRSCIRLKSISLPSDKSKWWGEVREHVHTWLIVEITPTWEQHKIWMNDSQPPPLCLHQFHHIRRWDCMYAFSPYSCLIISFFVSIQPSSSTICHAPASLPSTCSFSHCLPRSFSLPMDHPLNISRAFEQQENQWLRSSP